uniref:NUCB1-like N-terminal domain-containing protein n=1 Tax=Ciona savignyi TaxID=51511 RepID=H2YER3_CIOSA
MENADLDDIKSGSLSNEIYKVSGGIREQLNALKKEEMNRLRKILHAKVDLDKGNGQMVQKSAYLKQIADHLDHSSPHTFEAEDLTKLIKTATSDLENYDRDRHEEFKKFEMRKEMQREEKLKKLDEQERIKAQEEYRKQQEEQAQKSKIHHPGSRQQLDDVWENEDGLKDEEFNPKTFFYMHGQNRSLTLRHSSICMLEAIFEKDLEKIYPDGTDENVMQMEEERTRMREHVMKEVDTNNDGLITLKEFLRYSDSPEF